MFLYCTVIAIDQLSEKSNFNLKGFNHRVIMLTTEVMQT